MPFGSRQQICCEQVEIISSVTSLADVTSVLRALAVPDLPVVLYCPSEGLWPLPEFARLLPLASKLIIDSDAMKDSPSALAYLQGLPPRLRKADLVWSRLTPWREIIAHLFDSPICLDSVFDLEEIQILYHSADGEPSAVYYLAGWFMSVLGAGVKIRIAPGVGPDYASIAHVLMRGPTMKAAIDLTAPDTIEVTINDEHQQITMLPSMGNGAELRQELAIAGRDSRFEDALGLGHLMYSGQGLQS
jgi:glucose-6-phosphate dehydrogenase assembly protein OpcA